MRNIEALSGKKVLITGANGGLGSVVTEVFLEAGAAVVGSARSIAAGKVYNDRFTAIASDLSSAQDAARLAEEAAGAMRGLDVLVHLVGAWAGGHDIQDSDEAEFERMWSLNVGTAFNAIRAVIPQMRAQRSGRILAIGSRTAVSPAAGSAAYNAAKAGLVALVKTAAAENSAYGITANVVLPGTINTSANRSAMPQADVSTWVAPRDIAELLVYLASDGGEAVSGAAIPIYGRGIGA